jgi:hypothetical protein
MCDASIDAMKNQMLATKKRRKQVLVSLNWVNTVEKISKIGGV